MNPAVDGIRPEAPGPQRGRRSADTTPAGGPARRSLSIARRRSGESSLKAFAMAYLPHHFRLAPGHMHEELFQLLERLAQERSMRVAIAAPRNHAKSTLVSLAFALWCVVYQREPFLVLVSETADQAQDHLAQIKKELEENERLHEDFPELALEGAGGRRGRWRRDDFLTRPTDRQPGGVRVLALGAEQKMRGRRNRGERPSLIICDDLEDPDTVRQAEQREKRAEWFHGTLMKSGAVDMNAAVVGTILHHDSLLARLLDPLKCPGWLGRTYRSVRRWADRGDLWDQWESILQYGSQWQGHGGPDAAGRFLDANREAMLSGAEVLWPAQMPYPALMQMRARDGRASFATEMQNDPADPAARIFRDEDLRYWDDPRDPIAGDWQSLVEVLRRRSEYLTIVGACDPALGLSPGGDYSAIVTLAYERTTKATYVIGADIRRLRTNELLDAILENDRVFRYSVFGVEGTGFQSMLIEQLKDRFAARGRYPSVLSINPSQNKIARLHAMVPLIASGGVRFSVRHTMLLEQLKQLPGAAHDDGPDALEMALGMRRASRFRIPLPHEVML